MAVAVGAAEQAGLPLGRSDRRKVLDLLQLPAQAHGTLHSPAKGLIALGLGVTTHLARAVRQRDCNALLI